jgi:porin
LEQAGLSAGIDWVMDGFYSFHGGIRRGAIGASTLDAHLGLDMERLLGVRGGRFYADIEDHAGGNPSAGLVGDIQLFDRHNFKPYFEVYELWYQQRLSGDRIRLKLGKVDANTEFSVIDNGLRFLNSSAQVPATLFVLPTTPAPMPGINVFFTPKGPWYASFAAYDANRSDHFLDFSGHPEFVQPAANGQFLIAETGLRWSRIPALVADGDFRIGFWEHTGTFQGPDGSTQHGVQGLYVILDQTLWKPAPGPDEQRGVRGFLDYDQTDRRVAPIYRHVGAGITWTGFLTRRQQDSAGFGLQYARLSPGQRAPHDFELALEAFYWAQASRWAAVQPDLQYIVHPGGRYPAALVGTMRLKLNF